eukprot:TRINITY_DN6188_c0_g1::TRINITY_DN6188_c0_g1_i1::g.22688::m.22688 TRINITY_DN6188_c0_g1::TRINITY_DN6188_c0_g1_i1::g.22688  ORF type:complete len:106 (-),score=32.69,BAR/PF03114.13/0.00023,BAR_2/PF10455.4/0.072 TRINITY_DN6188_c0_g1_i1:209-526(-)
MMAYLKGEVKQAKELHRSCTGKREDYKTALSKAASIKKDTDSDTVRKLEQEVAEKEKDFELSRFDTVSKLHSVGLQWKIQYIERMCQIFQLQMKMYSTCMEKMKE